LTVDRLAGERGQPLIAAMSELTESESQVNERVTAFSAVLQGRSKLGYGLRFVSKYLWDEVLTWAVSHEKADNTWYTENLPTYPPRRNRPSGRGCAR
jgi:hypothetical protein